MIMDQHDKTGFRESPCKSFQAVLLHTGIAVRHPIGSLRMQDAR
jgi:hypothetical protein